MSDLDRLPRQRPSGFDSPTLLALRKNPPRMGNWAMQRRTELFGREVLLWPTPEHPAVPTQTPIAIVRDQHVLELDAWPTLADLRAQDRVLVRVEPEAGPRVLAYLQWLLELTHTAALPWSLAPYSTHPAGTHRLWLIAAARLVLPASVRVEARHDRIGIRLAQIALGFGADTLSGPISSERRLPVAGVTRPNETSLTGLRNLIEQAGLHPSEAPTPDAAAAPESPALRPPSLPTPT